MVILLSILSLILLTWLVGKINLSRQFSRQVKTLFDQSENISNLTFHKTQLDGLPDPVQRYFKLVLKERQSYVSYVRMKHDGQFKAGLDKNWINIKGEHYATTQKPGFIWKGVTAMFTAQDMYVAAKGRLTVSLLSLATVVNETGEKYNQGELLRWLGESVFYPTNLLPDDRLKWSAINDTTSKLTYNYNGLSLFFNITFNHFREIIEMETKRYMNKTDLETWIIKVSNYKEMNNMIIPTAFEVIWRLKKGDFSYAKFYITKLEYNNPNQF